jgi:hypothetical protein
MSRRNEPFRGESTGAPSDGLPAYLTRGRKRAARRRFLAHTGAATIAALAIPTVLAARAGAEAAGSDDDVVDGAVEDSSTGSESEDNSTSDAPGSPPYVSRGGWGADEDLRRDANGEEVWPVEYWPVQAVTVHHTGGYDVDSGWSAPAAVRDIYAEHATGRGYGDIGYHLLIDWDGVVYEGRYSGGTHFPLFDRWPEPSGPPALATGAHVYNRNVGNVGVALLGDLDSREVSDTAWASLEWVVAAIVSATSLDPGVVRRYRNPVNGVVVDAPTIGGHQDWDMTDCPGTVTRWLPDLRSDVARLATHLPAGTWLE